MEAKEYKIQEILTENKKYFIPPYQRPYSWGKDNAEQLIDDIYQSSRSDEREYFIGSMICINKGNNTFEVVDGQQRLTTLSLIVATLKDLIDAEGVKEDLQKRVLPIDVYSDEMEEPRLSVRKKESELYRFYILQDLKEYLPEKPTDTEQNFLENRKVIRAYLKDKGQSELKSLAKYLLHNVFVVFVQTDDFSSSFRLFNVLNNRGLPLSNADLLKNTLFEAANSSSSNVSQVEQAWTQIEEMVGVNRLDKFLTLHKLSEKADRDRVLQKGLDSYIQSLEKDFGGNAVEMSLMLLKSAKNFTKLIESEFAEHELRKRISTLRQLSNDEWVPPLLAFMNREAKVTASEQWDFATFVSVFEKVYIQGWVKKQVKSQREKVCYSTLVAINNGLNFPSVIDHIVAHADNDGFVAALNLGLYEPRPNQVNLTKAILLL